MAVMRSVQYVPGNNEKMVAKAPGIPADIITLDLEDSVPPAEKARAREVVLANLVAAGAGGAEIYVRVNNWETEMTDDDLEAIVAPGLHGVTLAKCGHPDNVRRLDWKLEELERRRGLEIGSVKVSLLLETAKGIIFAYDSCVASPRVVSAIFGAVDFTKDMRVKLTSEGEEQKYARRHVAVAARAAGVIAIDAPFVAYQDMDAFEANVRDGRQMGYEGRMIIHPSQVPVCNRLYAPDPTDVEWAQGVVTAFEEEAIAKGTAAISLNGKMVDTPVYENAKAILAAQREIEAKESQASPGADR
jgi:citrate lyase subunit beta/citryl-CoA lyase